MSAGYRFPMEELIWSETGVALGSPTEVRKYTYTYEPSQVAGQLRDWVAGQLGEAVARTRRHVRARARAGEGKFCSCLRECERRRPAACAWLSAAPRIAPQRLSV